MKLDEDTLKHFAESSLWHADDPEKIMAKEILRLRSALSAAEGRLKRISKFADRRIGYSLTQKESDTWKEVWHLAVGEKMNPLNGMVEPEILTSFVSEVKQPTQENEVLELELARANERLRKIGKELLQAISYEGGRDWRVNINGLRQAKRIYDRLATGEGK